MTNLTETEEYQWSMYKACRMNAIWFSRTEPVSIAMRKQIDPLTHELSARMLVCTPKELQNNTYHWIQKAIELWQENKSLPLFAQSATTPHIKSGTAKQNTTDVTSATPYGVPDCYCPECMLEIIRQYQNPALKLELEKYDNHDAR